MPGDFDETRPFETYRNSRCDPQAVSSKVGISNNACTSCTGDRATKSDSDYAQSDLIYFFGSALSLGGCQFMLTYLPLKFGFLWKPSSDVILSSGETPWLSCGIY